jgi:3-isopropylmalate dehydrogenase
MSTYDFKDEAKGEINPAKFFRKSLDLFANIRPSRTYTGV